MEIKKRIQDVEIVFDQMWKAKQNGIKNTKENESEKEKRKEILKRNSVEGQVARLEENMKAASMLINKNKYR